MKTELRFNKRGLTLKIFRRTLPLMASSVYQQIEDLLHRIWLDDLHSWLTGFGAGQDNAQAADEDVRRN